MSVCPLGYSWYAKKNLVCVVDEYPNLDLICNARYDSVIYAPAPQRTGKRGRPAKHGERLSPDKDFSLSDDKIGDYYIGVRRVLTNIFGYREVFAYVTSAEKESTSRRLSFCSYMVRSRKGIETLVNLINIAYCAMKILPYQDEAFAKYRTESVQEFRFVLSEQIRAEVFFAAFVQNIENSIKSNVVVKALTRLIQQKVTHL